MASGTHTHRRRLVGSGRLVWTTRDLSNTPKTDRKNLVFLVEGPWNHGGMRGRGRSLAKVDLGSDTGAYYRREIETPWFAYYLKGNGQLRQGEATIFQSGTNKWMTYDAWPASQRAEGCAVFANRRARRVVHGGAGGARWAGW